jgi:uncharacterized protein (TIGR02145 family)
MKKINRVWIYSLTVIGLVLFLINSCKKDDTNNTNQTSTGQVPILITNAVSAITQTNASCGGNITSDGGITVTVRGVCWSTGLTPTIAESKTTDGTGAGSFTSAITNLSPNTTYYVRAYATNSSGTGYGSAMSFTTQQGNGTVTDLDGNVYNTVTIGTQIWMVEDLKVTKYRNGDPIPNVTDNTSWSTLYSGAYCDFNNDTSYSSTYGKLYNWYAVNDSRKIAPAGWHVPTDAEWTILTTSLGGESVAGGKLKEMGLSHWVSPNTGATNEVSFTALPGGDRHNNGVFENFGTGGYRWCSSTYSTNIAWSRSIFYNSINVIRSAYYDQYGFSVRCIKD